MLKGAVLGFGGVGQELSRQINCRDDARIVVVCDRDTATLETAQQLGLAATDDPAEAVAFDVDFVLVTSSNAAHCQHVLLAATAGKPIFCEKPLALNLKDAVAMADAVNAAGVLNVVNYTMRYMPAYRRLKDMIEAGDFGRVLSAWSFRQRGAGLYCAGARHNAIIHPAESGGWTVHHACHNLDMLYWWLGPMTKVYAAMNTTAPPAPIYSEEVLFGIVHFASGATGMVGDSVGIMRDQHSGIVGTEASAILTGEGDQVRIIFRSERTGAEQVLHPPPTNFSTNGVAHFLDCLIYGSASQCSFTDAIPSLTAALGMQKSNHVGQAVELDSLQSR